MKKTKKGPKAGQTAFESISKQQQLNNNSNCPENQYDIESPATIHTLFNKQGYEEIEPDNIPKELKEHEQWVVWRAEEKNNKLTKVHIV